jgi:hypothetical protein
MAVAITTRSTKTKSNSWRLMASLKGISPELESCDQSRPFVVKMLAGFEAFSQF